MNRKKASVIGAAALCAAPAFAGPPAIAEPAVPVAASYADLLQPITNPVERLRASDAEMAQRPPQAIPAQYYHHHHHHHHHHSNDWYRGHGYYWNGLGWIFGVRPYYHHHHHAADWYRAHGYYWNGNGWVISEPPPDPYGYRWNGYRWVPR